MEVREDVDKKFGGPPRTPVYACSTPRFRSRRGETGPPRGIETADTLSARKMPRYPYIHVCT